MRIGDALIEFEDLAALVVAALGSVGLAFGAAAINAIFG